MTEQYGGFMWDYYGGRAFRPFYGGMAGPSWRLRAMDTGMGCTGEQELGRDMEYFETMYPDRMKQIEKSVGEVCDAIDYDGSILYDEYPDRVGLRRLCDEVYCREVSGETGEEEKQWIQAACEVLLYHEVCRRRVKKRELRNRYWRGI